MPASSQLTAGASDGLVVVATVFKYVHDVMASVVKSKFVIVLLCL